MLYNKAMREWNLQAGDPLALVLASDARYGPTDYLNDQIWELKIGLGDPPAVSLNTTYGLRAKAARLFFRFTNSDQIRSDPTEFLRPPTIHQVFPNFIRMSFAPFTGIEVELEFFVPHSHALAGRVTVTNSGNIERRLVSELALQLSANEGQRMAPFETGAATLLSGATGGLSPVLFVTGGAKAGSGSYPSLALTYQMTPGEQRRQTWALVALGDREASSVMARELAAQNWDANRARIEMLNASQVEIYTGDPDWDAAFMLSQKQAAALLIGPAAGLPERSYVLSRQPDQGFSLNGEGSDYNHLWNGQPVLETCYLVDILLPFAAEDAKNLLRNYLSIQEESGAIDWKPGLAGQRSKMLAPPLLASLAYRIYEQTEDTAFLEEVYERLRLFLGCWFTVEHDRDQDGLPEPDNLHQLGLDYHPVFSRWQPDSSGVDIRTSESPALLAMLYHEIQSLSLIEKTLQKKGVPVASNGFDAHAARLKSAIEAGWDNTDSTYRGWDRDTHRSAAGELILEERGACNMIIRRDFDNPIRLLIQVRTDETVRRRPLIFVHGRGASGYNRIERIEDDQFRWIPGVGLLTGKYVYTRLDWIEVCNLEPEDQITIRSVDYRMLDITLLAPLWAGIPEADQARALIEETVAYPGLFWREYGLPTLPQITGEMDQTACWGINLPWNVMVGEGLLRYGERQKARELVERIMSALIQSLKKERLFRRSYHAETGLGLGETNALGGLAPVGFFLETLGVRLISPRRIGLAGFNPFPWPVTVKYRGASILRQQDKTVVVFPDGQTVEVTDPEPRLISLEVHEH